MTQESAGYSRSDELADSMMFEDAGSTATGSSDTYATEHVPSAKKSKKKQDDLTTREYYFEGIEKLSTAQISRLDKLYQRRDELRSTLDKLSGKTDQTPKEQIVKLTPEQIAANQRARIAGIDISKFVKAGWQLESGNNYVGLWNPDDLLPVSGPTAVLIPVKGLNPSKSDPSRINMKQILAGEQEPELWEPGLSALFMSVPHASEDHYSAMIKFTNLQAVRKDKPPKTAKVPRTKKEKK